MMLANVGSIVYIIGAYFSMVGLSFLIPSTSGLATMAMPIFGPLTETVLGNSNIIVNIFNAASGLVNLITPTSAVVMGGLAICKIGYGT